MSRKNNLLILSTTVVVVLTSLILAIKTGVIDEYYTGILTLAGINIILVLSLNLITGFAGQLALGHAGFMSIGAYSSAILVLTYGFPIYLSIPLAGVITAVFGLLIGAPSLRLRGDYLAITTLGFGEVIRVMMIYFDKITGGAAGLKGIKLFTDNDALSSIIPFCWVFAGVIVAICIVYNLINSSQGRAIISVREDEIAANSMGINVSYYKVLAFVFSAFLAGVAGGLYAHLRGYLNPMDYGFLKSVDILVMMVLGGLGSITGGVISAIVLTFLPEVLRFLSDYRLVIYSVLLIAIMIFKPSGLMGNKEISLVKALQEFSFKNLFKSSVEMIKKTISRKREGEK